MSSKQSEIKKPVQAIKKQVHTSESKKQTQPEDKVLKTKDSIISGILRRWWYCMPEWPPKDYNYNKKLEENKMRLVDLKNWKFEVDVDSKGKIMNSF